jgi:hypothetical protein
VKKTAIFILIITVALVQGCAPLSKNRPLFENTPQAADNTDKRFQIIQEQGETNNIGGFTVIKDTATEKEYLIITGLNGAVTVTDLK